MNHEVFLRRDFVTHLSTIAPDTKPYWGVMSVQHMLEHMADAFRLASGKDQAKELLTPPEKIEKAQSFILSDTPFKENTKNALMPAEPLPLRYGSITEAIQILEEEIEDFFIFYEKNPEATLLNPFFGYLDFKHQTHLLSKHARHHLRQFGIEYC